MVKLGGAFGLSPIPTKVVIPEARSAVRNDIYRARLMPHGLVLAPVISSDAMPATPLGRWHKAAPYAVMTLAYLALSVAIAVALAVRLAWPTISRRLGRIRPEDQAAIDLFLANRDEAALSVKKEIWAGGPDGGIASANLYGLPRRGRFYHVLARDGDGSRYRHELAATGERPQGDLTLFQQNADGYWVKVLQ